MTASPEIKIVVFDWGNVILKIVSSWEEACKRANLPFRPEVSSPTSKSRRQELAKLHQLGHIQSPDFFEKISNSIKGLYSPQEFQIVHDAWLISEFAGISQLIDDIHANNKATTGLLSNTNAAHWQRHLGTPQNPADFPTVAKLRHKHASHLMGLAKPEIEIYKAFETLSGFKPANILFFDDLEENIKMAQSRGWTTIHIAAPVDDTTAQIRHALQDHAVL